MNADELIPGQFVKVRSAGTFVAYWHFVRWLGVVDGWAVVEDATGSRCAVPMSDVFAVDHDARAVG